MTAQAAPRPDRLLGGRYRLTEHIGSGGAADVWRAQDERLEREVAVKILGQRAGREFRDRFTEEARRAARVTHPNVVTVYDQGTDGDDAWMVMEYVPGLSLRELIEREGPLPPQDAVRIVEQVAAALDAAHGAGVVHLDVKPANVIVDRAGLAKLADFGVATAAHGEAERELIGTARYVAPERIEGAPPTPRSDVYGLGLVAYELLAGRPAFAGVDTDELLRLRLDGAAPSLRAARPDVSPEVDRVVARALERDPERRFRSAGDLARALSGAVRSADATVPLSVGAAIAGLTRGPSPAARPLSAPRSLRLPPLDSTLAILAVTLVLLAVLALFINVGGLTPEGRPDQRPAAATAAPAPRPTAPNLVGRRLSEAITIARRAGYEVAYVGVRASGRSCSVLSQEPAAGAQHGRGQHISVRFVSGSDCLEDDD